MHSEILLLTLLSSDVEEERHFAVNKTLSICGKSEYGDTSNRPFKVPKLNWEAKKLEELIDSIDDTESIASDRSVDWSSDWSDDVLDYVAARFPYEKYFDV